MLADIDVVGFVLVAVVVVVGVAVVVDVVITVTVVVVAVVDVVLHAKLTVDVLFLAGLSSRAPLSPAFILKRMRRVAQPPAFAVAVPANTMWRKLLYSGFETSFGPSTQGAGFGAGAKTHLKSRFCAILKKRGRDVRF